MIGFRVDLTGDREVQRELRTLADVTAKRVISQSVREDAKELKRIIKTEIKRIAVKTGSLWKAVIMRVRVYRGAYSAVVGPSYRGAPHQHLVERGTRERFRKVEGGEGQRGYTGKMPAMWPVSRAFRAHAKRITNDVTRKILHRIMGAR